MNSKKTLTLFFLVAFFLNAKTTQSQVIWYGNPNKNYLESFYRLSKETGEQASVNTSNDAVMGKVWNVNKPAGSKRSELARTNGYIPAEGETVYVGWRYKFSIAGEINPSGGMAVFQLKSQDDGSQNYPILIGYTGSKLSLVKYVAGTTPQANRATRLWEASVNEGQWVSVVIGIKFSRNENLGYVEFWFNGVKQDLVGNTIDKRVIHRTLDDFGNYFKWGAYNENARPYNVTVNLDEMRVAKTYEEAEPNNYDSNSNLNIPVGNVSISPSSLNIITGQTSQLTATITPITATNKNVTYTSSNTNIVTVDNNGLVRAVNPGNATITVKTINGNKTATATLKVNPLNLPLPTSWLTTTIGNVGVTGSATYSGGNFTIAGSGADIWGTTDAFRFVYQKLSGDGEIMAKVNSLTNTNPWSKAGVMIRESLTPDSKNVAAVVTPSNGISFQTRTIANSPTSFANIPTQTTPKWLKLKRTGNLLAAFYSNDGTNWTQIGTNTTIAMNNTIYVGMCVTSHENTALCTAILSNASVVKYAPVVTNLALNKAITVSSQQIENPGMNLVDGNPDTRWSASNYNQSAIIDLGALYSISKTELICYEDRAYQYIIEAATTPAGNYTIIVDRSTNTTAGTNIAPITNSFKPINARYIKITVSGASNYIGTWVSLEELRVYGIASSAREPINTKQDNSTLKLYPVPTQNELHIVSENYENILKYEVVDLSGRILINQTNSINAETTLDVSVLPEGQYLLKTYKRDASIEVSRFIK